MSNLSRLALLSSVCASVFATDVCAAQPQPAIQSNMVMLPLDLPLEPTPPATAAPQASPDNMVVVEDNMVVVPEINDADIINKVYVPITGPNYVEAGVNYHNVSNNQGNWSGQFIAGQVQTDPWNRWNAQLQHQKAFHDEGYLVAVGNTHTFDEEWFSNVGIALGTNANFLSRFRADAAINRRWPGMQNLVTTAGLSYSRAENTYSSTGLLLGASYYFNAPWVIQGGVRLDRSDPGSVYGYSTFGAVTYGYQKRFFLTATAGYGREAYQLLGAGAVVNEFNSHNFGLNWRQWIGEDWGFNLGSEYYTNPAYHRTGGTFSIFKEF